ncbi:MAG: SseB family protein, partial [Planctomycetota bacterium]
RFVHGTDGRLAYAAFTHYESLRAMAPEGMPYKTMSGAEFFPMVRDKSVEIVIINPAGPISAELRAKQIETLASAGLKARKGH